MNVCSGFEVAAIERQRKVYITLNVRPSAVRYQGLKQHRSMLIYGKDILDISGRTWN